MFVRRRCSICKTKITKETEHTLQLETADGLHEMTLCDECAETFEQMAEAAIKGER